MAGTRPRAGVAAPTRAEALGRQVADRIVSGALRPGQRLDEQVLAQEYGVSRTPVREALRQLVATGLVDVRPRRGAVVACPDLTRLRESFDVLAELEGLCARWSALRMTPRERAGLDVHHRAMAAQMRASDRTGYSQANQAFHALVYAGAHNERLGEVVTDTTRRLAPYRGAQFNAPQRLARSHAEHDAVVEAILRADGDGAAQAMTQHIRSSAETWWSLATAASADIAAE